MTVCDAAGNAVEFSSAVLRVWNVVLSARLGCGSVAFMCKRTVCCRTNVSVRLTEGAYFKGSREGMFGIYKSLL